MYHHGIAMFRHCQQITFALSYGNVLKGTRPDWRHRVWLNIWIRQGDPITPLCEGPGWRKLTVGPRSVVYGPGSGLRQLHSPSPKSYVNVSGRLVLRPISVRDWFEKRRFRPITNAGPGVRAGREAWLWNLGCRRGGSIRRRRRLVGRRCVCPLLNSTNGPGKDCLFETSCQTRSTRFCIAGMKRNSFHLNQIAGVVWRKRVGRRSHFVPTVCERKKDRDIKNTKRTLWEETRILNISLGIYKDSTVEINAIQLRRDCPVCVFWQHTHTFPLTHS